MLKLSKAMLSKRYVIRKATDGKATGSIYQLFFCLQKSPSRQTVTLGETGFIKVLWVLLGTLMYLKVLLGTLMYFKEL